MQACSLSDILYSEHNPLDKYYRTFYVIPPLLEVICEAGKWKKVDMQSLSNCQVLLEQGTKP